MNAPTTTLRQVSNVREMLAHPAALKQLQSVAASHMKPDRLVKVVANSFRQTPKLAEAEPMSLLGAMMTCATLGLEPNTPMGEAYLIPFRNNRKQVTEVQLIIGYRGFIELAYRSGKVLSIEGGIHYSDDDMWDYERGTNFRLRHVEGPQEGDKLHAYALARIALPEGREGFAAAVLPWSKVIATRNRSQNWQSAEKYGKTASNPWSTDEDAMAIKTAVRALQKWLPKSAEMATATQVDEARTDFRGFAMNPEMGLPAPDEDDNTIDAEATEAEDEPEPQQERRQSKPTPRQEKAAPARRDTSGKPYDPRNEKPKEQAKPEPEKAPEPQEEQTGFLDNDNEVEAEFAALKDKIIGELQAARDENTIDDLMATYDDHLQQMKANAPAMYEAVAEAEDAERGRVSGED